MSTDDVKRSKRSSTDCKDCISCNISDEEKVKCEEIIKSKTSYSSYIDYVPIPGTGYIADLTSITGMTIRLSNIFGVSINNKIALEILNTAVNHVGRRYLIKKGVKDVTKVIPVVGPIIGEKIGNKIGNIIVDEMLELVGWEIVEILAVHRNQDLTITNEPKEESTMNSNSEPNISDVPKNFKSNNLGNTIQNAVSGSASKGFNVMSNTISKVKSLLTS